MSEFREKMLEKYGKKDKFETISLKKLRENEEENPLSDKDYAIWDFMVSANIESMTYKNLPNDAICIRLNTLSFKSPLD